MPAASLRRPRGTSVGVTILARPRGRIHRPQTSDLKPETLTDTSLRAARLRCAHAGPQPLTTRPVRTPARIAPDARTEVSMLGLRLAAACSAAVVLTLLAAGAALAAPPSPSPYDSGPLGQGPSSLPILTDRASSRSARAFRRSASRASELSTVGPQAAASSSDGTLTVDDNGADCPNARFTTIQSAVDRGLARRQDQGLRRHVRGAGDDPGGQGRADALLGTGPRSGDQGTSGPLVAEVDRHRLGCAERHAPPLHDHRPRRRPL